MTKGRFSSTTIGRVAIAIGILGLLEFPLALLQNIGIYTIDIIFMSEAIVGITGGILALMLYAEHYKQSKLLGGIAAAFALVGSLTITRGAVLNLLVYQRSDYKLIDAGFSLLGLWILGLIILTGYAKQLPRSLVVLGLVIGAVLALSFLAMPEPWLKYPWLDFLQGEIHLEDLPEWSRWFFYPVWCIFLGRHLIHKPTLNIAEN